jgi:cytochrome c
MDFLKQLALPQSAAQIEVLHFVMNFVSLLLLPFISYLFGALLFSLYFGRKGRTQNDRHAMQLSGDVIEHVMPNKSILFLFGVVPYIALVFAYAQLLQGTDTISVGVLTWGALFFIAGSAFASSYHSAFKVGSVLDGVTKESDEVKSIRAEVSEQKRTSGKYAVLFLFFGIFFLYAGRTLAASPDRWDDVYTIVQLFFSLTVLVKFLLFIALSFTAASVGTLFFTFSWEGGKKGISQEYASYVRSALLPAGLISLLAQPLLIAGSLMLAPKAGLSGTVFIAAFFALFFLFIVIHLVYGMFKNFRPAYAAQGFFVLIFAFLSLVIVDTTSLSNATRNQTAVLAYKYDKYHEELLSKMGISLVVISGEEIYSAKCSACHEFGIKKVGPAYKDVLPKYTDDRAKLASFVLNPVKVDPAFPPMPNQGLKPAEADSIAAYILRMYKQ